MSAVRNVTELVDRKMELADVGSRFGKMPQSTEDTFTREDRRELYKQSIQGEQVLRDLADIKTTARDNMRTHQETQEAHEKRLRDLEDFRLKLRTEIDTSWRWIVAVSSITGAAVSFLVRFFFK